MSQRTLTAFFKRPPASPLASPSRKRAVSARARRLRQLAHQNAPTRANPPSPGHLCRRRVRHADRARSRGVRGGGCGGNGGGASGRRRGRRGRAVAAPRRPPDRALLEGQTRSRHRPGHGPAGAAGERVERPHAGLPPRPPHLRALNTVPLPSVRVVIIGQDPYHGPGQAEGLSSRRRGKASLRRCATFTPSCAPTSATPAPPTARWPSGRRRACCCSTRR